MESLYKKYLELLDIKNIPDFLHEYLETPSIKRLKGIGYFCGMDYASKNIYDFKEYISRFDHSLSTALLTWKYTHDKTMTLASLFHDVATPCFSHVIDYMNNDYITQESTEQYADQILNFDHEFKRLIQRDGIIFDDICNFKKYTLVDNERPKMCFDRLDGIILTGLFWSKELDIKTVKSILDNTYIAKNEFTEVEIAFKSLKIGKILIDTNSHINELCHSIEDIYMMNLLAKLTKKAIEIGLIDYSSLYQMSEMEILEELKKCENRTIKNYYTKFKNIKKGEIPKMDLPVIKNRKIAPIIAGKRMEV